MLDDGFNREIDAALEVTDTGLIQEKVSDLLPGAFGPQHLPR